jgi:hypothetical protein
MDIRGQISFRIRNHLFQRVRLQSSRSRPTCLKSPCEILRTRAQRTSWRFRGRDDYS